MRRAVVVSRAGGSRCGEVLLEERLGGSDASGSLVIHHDPEGGRQQAAEPVSESHSVLTDLTPDL